MIEENVEYSYPEDPKELFGQSFINTSFKREELSVYEQAFAEE